MAFDIDIIKKVYNQMQHRVDNAREAVGHPLTLSEKILYNHLWNSDCLLYTSPSPRDRQKSRMPSSA